MKSDVTVIHGPEKSDATPRVGRDTGPRGPGIEESYRRLGWIAAIAAGVAVFALVLMFAVHTLAMGRIPVTRNDVMWTAASAMVALVMLLAVRGNWFPARAFVPVALSFEVFIGIVMSSGLMGWQYRVAWGGTEWLQQAARPPWALGAGEVPWVAVWILLFASLVPLRPREQLWGALAASLTVPLFPLISLALYGTPPELAADIGQLTGRMILFLSYPTIAAVGMAWYVAHRVYGLRQDLSRAREMGSYRLVDKLGEGGMGEVWRAEHRMLARPAAIKLIRADAVREEDAAGATPGSTLARFEREVQATAQLKSPHTIEVYDFGRTDDGTFYYVMELLDGLDLQELVESGGPLPPARVAYLLEQACQSLAEAHSRGLIHRDIKPANIFLCRLGLEADVVKILDFGLVKETAAPKSSELTQMGHFAGTPSYAAPEAAGAGLDVIDSRVDIYALGCVAFYLLTGRTVFKANNALQMLMKHATEAPQPPSALMAEPLAPAFEELVLACLAKKPEDRIGSAAELKSRLEELRFDEPWAPSLASAWWAAR